MKGRYLYMKNHWDENAKRAFDRLVKIGKPFTSDDLIGLVGHPDDSHQPNSTNNGIGRLFRIAHAKKQIEVVDYTNSKQPTRNGGIIRVWKKVDS